MFQCVLFDMFQLTCQVHLIYVWKSDLYYFVSFFKCGCSLYDQIFRPSKLPANADFHCFKTGIEPKWEDPECANGGKWSVTSSRKTNLDTMWLETVRTCDSLTLLSNLLVLLCVVVM